MRLSRVLGSRNLLRTAAVEELFKKNTFHKISLKTREHEKTIRSLFAIESF